MTAKWHKMALLSAASLLMGMVLEIFLRVRWWHPYCDTRADGPGYFARGFPLPHSIPTGASSLETDLSVPLYLIDLAALAILVALICRALDRLFKASPLQRLARAYACLLLLALLSAPIILVLHLSSYPTMGFQLDRDDDILSFRPAFLVDRETHHRCNM